MESILNAIQARNKLFLSGPFGSGKTTLALERVRWLLGQERVRGDDILILVPQRTLSRPYYEALRSPDFPPGAPPRVTTLASLARQSVDLYWPLIAEQAKVGDPHREPTFLTLETSQYHMAGFVDAAIEKGAFDGVRVERSRVISQVLDNLNKAALFGFDIGTVYQRLELAVPNDGHLTARLNALRAAKEISDAFQRYCREHTLLDFSLQIELFNDQVLALNQPDGEKTWGRTHFMRSHRHLIFDNAEEDTFTAHRLVKAWLPTLDSALIIHDLDGGFRTFLGADPEGIAGLRGVCEREVTLTASQITPPGIAGLAAHVKQRLRAPDTPPSDEALPDLEQALDRLVLPQTDFRFYPQMIDWTVDEVARLVHDEGIPAANIALLAPFVSDAMRFSLQSGLTERGIMLTTHRPSRALQDEPAARCLVTLATLGHPLWGIRAAPSDVTLALSLSMSELDPVRAGLLSQIVYPPQRRSNELGRFGDLESAMQERITYAIGGAYDHLREWLYSYRAESASTPLDQFFARLFGEVLSQHPFGFHDDYDAARIANQLVESARSFRWALESSANSTSDHQDPALHFGSEYITLFESGALGALYVPGWREAEEAVFLAPAYTFLMRNRAVDIQFWLDIGSSGWWERLYQPLTHPYVLSPRWPSNRLWTDADEFKSRQEAMRQLLVGLIRRTRQHIYVGTSDYSESGFEQSGPLLNLINRLLVARARA